MRYLTTMAFAWVAGAGMAAACSAWDGSSQLGDGGGRTGSWR